MKKKKNRIHIIKVSFEILDTPRKDDYFLDKEELKMELKSMINKICYYDIETRNLRIKIESKK